MGSDGDVDYTIHRRLTVSGLVIVSVLLVLSVASTFSAFSMAAALALDGRP